LVGALTEYVHKMTKIPAKSNSCQLMAELSLRFFLALLCVVHLHAFSYTSLTPLKCHAQFKKERVLLVRPLRMSTTLDPRIPVGSGKEKPYATKASEVVDSRSIQAFYLRHILVETPEMARAILEEIKKGQDFSELAQGISACAQTRSEGGAIGWVDALDAVSTSPVNTEAQAVVEELLPNEAREAISSNKPGDIVLVQSTRGWHLIKVEDVMTKLNTLSKVPGKRLPGSGVERSPLRDLMDAKDRQMTYTLETMGCQMNVADSERMEGQLEDLGFVKSDDPSKTDVFVVNTCSIRDHAEQKVYAAIGNQAKRKHKGDPVAIVVAGCVAQQEGENLLKRVPELDLVMGPQYANRIGDLLEDVINGNQVVATDPTLIMEDISKPRRGSETCAWVNIIYGCNEHCTYCVVPGTRGVEQSRPRESIRKEIEDLAKVGFREITLLGQNIDAYGRDMSPKQNFADLLHYVSQVEGIERIRYVTSHPRYMSMRVIDAVANLPNVCECFYVPFQSGSNKVLKSMRRGYTVERYMQIIDRIKELSPDASICGDVIVGFPGETEEDFQGTLDLMEKVKFDNLNSFTYSPRPFTPAADWEDQVPEDVKADRLQRLQRLAIQHATEKSERYLGRVEEILVEERNPKNINQVKGRTRTNRPVFFDGDIDVLKGKLVPVKIEETRPWSLTGVQVGEPY